MIVMVEGVGGGGFVSGFGGSWCHMFLVVVFWGLFLFWGLCGGGGGGVGFVGGGKDAFLGSLL